MKNKKSLLFISLYTTSLLASCGGSKEMMETIQVPSIYSGAGAIRVVGSDFISPFDTSITANLYCYQKEYTENQLKEIKSTIQDTFVECHALSDRHYTYYKGDPEDGGNEIINVKYINDCCGENITIKVEPFLYNLLKKSYEFTIQSNGKFNMFLGSLADIYETKLENLDSENKSALDSILEYSTDLHFSSFTEEEKNKIAEVVDTLPKTKADFEGILEFNDEYGTVKFNSYKGTKLKISLGGNAKGFATEYVSSVLQEKYPNISLLINSGFSSIKALGKRPDNKAWKIRYNNPVYYETKGTKENKYCSDEIAVEIDSGFNLSTSGYYQQYFYEYDKESDLFIRRNHIVDANTGYSASYFDQMSVFLDDAGLADMYTTALMNCSSIDEANSLFASLNSYYEQSDAQVLYCFKSNISSSNELFKYSINDFNDLSASNLPIAIKKDGSEYDGDYSDISLSDIKDIKSSFSPSFNETYLLSSGLYAKARKLTDSEMTVQGKTKIALLEELK